MVLNFACVYALLSTRLFMKLDFIINKQPARRLPGLLSCVRLENGLLEKGKGYFRGRQGDRRAHSLAPGPHR
jgi:hypothetical protein